MKLLDRVDTSILALLQDDARQSNAAVARVLGVSEATVRRRIKALVDNDIVAIRAVPDPDKFGFPTSAMFGIHLEPNMLDSVAPALQRRPEVTFLGSSTGRFDLLVRVRMKDLVELREFLEGFLAKVPGVRKAETIILLAIRKRNLGRINLGSYADGSRPAPRKRGREATADGKARLPRPRSRQS